MRIKSFLTSEGKEGQSYHLESTDEGLVCLFDKVGSSTRAVNLKATGKATMITNYYTKVKTKDGKEYTLTLTAGQAKQAQKHEPLTNKIINGRGYKNKFGEQIGLTVVDPSVK